LIAICAFLGGILAAFFGWTGSQETFNPRKFGASVGFALLAGLGYAVTYSYSETIGVRDYFLAVLGGAGWDVLTNRAVGTAEALRKSKTVPPG